MGKCIIYLFWSVVTWYDMFENRKHISFVNQWFSTFYIWHPVRTLSISPNTNQLTNPRNSNRPYTPKPIALFQAVGHKSLKQALLPGTSHLSTLSRCLNVKCDTLEAIQRHKKSLRRLPELPVWRRYGCLKSRLIGIILQTLLSESYWNICAIFLSKAYLFVIMPTKCKILGGWVCLSIGFKSRWPSNYRIIVMTHNY
mgnify:FL=1